MVILPRLCGARGSVAALVVPSGERSPHVDASQVASASQGYVDELCALFIRNRVDQVVFSDAPNRLQKLFLRSCFLRGAKFSVSFLDR